MNKIFIIDDIPEILDFIRMRLISLGHEDILYFNDPLDALKRIRDNVIPDIVISDFQMPGMSGPELVDTIKSINPELFAVIMTADENNADLTSYPVILKHNLLALCDELSEFIKSEGVTV